MAYQCFHCDNDSDQAHSITIYKEDGTEDHLEVLCENCYDEWLHSLKG